MCFHCFLLHSLYLLIFCLPEAHKIIFKNCMHIRCQSLAWQLLMPQWLITPCKELFPTLPLKAVWKLSGYLLGYRFDKDNLLPSCLCQPSAHQQLCPTSNMAQILINILIGSVSRKMDRQDMKEPITACTLNKNQFIVDKTICN